MKPNTVAAIDLAVLLASRIKIVGDFNLKNNLINRVIQSNFEMGSTFKPITVAMGYDKDLISPDMTFDVTKKIKGISDYSKYEGNGIYNVEKIIFKSNGQISASSMLLSSGSFVIDPDVRP